MAPGSRSQPASAWPLLLLPVTLFLRMAFNAIDGLMAKEHGQASAQGAVLNELSDVIADAALYLPFALIAGLNAPLVVLVVVAGIIAEMAGALGPHARGQRAAMPGRSARATAPSPSACSRCCWASGSRRACGARSISRACCCSPR